MAGGVQASSAVVETPETPFEKRVGHHPGLFALFFAEMWERFSYYGMRALLVFYMTKDFLAYNDERGYEVYGAYTALVYMTPFLGGMIADRMIGQRAAVILGGTLMALGHLVMTQRSEALFFAALALLIVGNGFFKPNIGTILGTLYSQERLQAKRDGAFTIFYMGVNLGAAIAPLLCGYVGETYGWHYGFGLATLGMMIGLAIFVAPTAVTQGLIGMGALASAVALVWTGTRQTEWVLIVNAFVAVALVIAMGFALWALANGALPEAIGTFKKATPVEANAPSHRDAAVTETTLVDRALLRRNLAIVVVATLVIVPVFAWLVNHSAVAGWVLIVVGVVALAYVLFEAYRVTPVERHRLFVILAMAFFSMLFWAFFEQAGSSINNFTDRNVDRASEARRIAPADVGQTLEIAVNQEQLGFVADHGVFTEAELVALSERARAQEAAAEEPGARSTATRLFWRIDASLAGQTVDLWVNPAEAPVATRVGAPGSPVQVGATVPLRVTESLVGHRHTELFTLTVLDAARAAAQAAGESEVRQRWVIGPEHVGMGIEGGEVPASVFQAANPVFILLFGLVFTALWTWLAARKLEPSTPIKFVFALLQLGAGFLVLYLGAQNADARGMVGMSWLVLAYLLHTTGELCLSPVGLSMVSKLSPARMVATMMGAWYLATAFSQYLSGIIAGLTGVHEEGSGPQMVPVPTETLGVYADVFLKIGIAACVAAVLLAVLSPFIQKGMHQDGA